MTEKNDDQLENAALLALDALDEVERARLLKRVAQAPDAERAEFDAEVTAVREALAELSSTTAAAPPAELRGRLLERIDEDAAADADADTDSGKRRPAWKMAAAAAAAVVVGVGGVAIGYSIADRSAPAEQSNVDEIFAAPDVRTTSGALAGGRATVTYSPSTGEGILVMNQVPKPAPGTVYQIWLDGPSGQRLAGTMSEGDVTPSTTAVIADLGGATSMDFTVGDAATPEERIGEPVASLPLN